MAQWDDFRYFLALHKNRTLKAAAQSLKVDQATVGRRISALEQSLGSRLFEKRSDGYFLTLAGERIRPHLEKTEEDLLSVERIAAGHDERIEGLVRIALPGALADHWLIPRLKPLLAQHPKLELSFLTGSEVVNLSRREADLALRLVKPGQRDLITKKVGEISLSLHAHRSLFADAKRPTKMEDLAEFPFVGLEPEVTSELERTALDKLEGHLRYAIRTTSWNSVFHALQAGLGIGILPDFMVNRELKLTRLPFADGARAPLWMVVHPETAQSARVRKVMDYMASLFR